MPRLSVVGLGYDACMKMKSPREDLAELRAAGKLELTEADFAIIREVTSGAQLAEELDALVPADD